MRVGKGRTEELRGCARAKDGERLGRRVDRQRAVLVEPRGAQAQFPQRVAAPTWSHGPQEMGERKRTVLTRTAHHLAVAARVKLEERADVVHLAAVRLPAVVARVVPLEL